MQAADDVKFGDALGVAAAGALPDFLQRKGVGGGVLGFLAKSAEFAAGHAHVGGINVTVDVEESLVSVKSLTDLVRHPADAEEVGGAVKRQAVFRIQTLAALDFVADRQQAGIVKNRCHRKRYFQKMSLAQNTKNITLT